MTIDHLSLSSSQKSSIAGWLPSLFGCPFHLCIIYPQQVRLICIIFLFIRNDWYVIWCVSLIRLPLENFWYLQLLNFFLGRFNYLRGWHERFDRVVLFSWYCFLGVVISDFLVLWQLYWLPPSKQQEDGPSNKHRAKHSENTIHSQIRTKVQSLHIHPIGG